MLNNQNTPENNTDFLNQSLREHNKTLRIPNGVFKCYTFGPGSLNETPEDYTNSIINILGEGRNSTLILEDDNPNGTIFLMDNQGDWFDGSIKHVAMYGNGKPGYILDSSGYSISYKHLYIRADQEQASTGSNGLRVKKGQDFSLDNVQVEFCTIGVHLDDVRAVSISNINVEFCDIGLLISRAGKGRQISIDRVYAESSPIAVQIEDGCSVKLNNGIYTSKELVAANLIGADTCYLDMSNGQGKVILDEASHNNVIIVPDGGDAVTVEDNGYLNEIRTQSQPVYVLDDEENDWVVQFTGQNSELRDIVIPFNTNEEKLIEYKYCTSGQAQISIQYYDELNTEIYEFETQTWVPLAQGGSVANLPYKSNQCCKSILPIKIGDKQRNVSIRFVITKAGNNTIKLWKPNIV